MSEHQQHLTDYLAAFIDELSSNGVDEAVISPGSRSTPLALLLTHHPRINTYVNVDERSAAFFALGIAKAKRKPVILVCTSGTAAANYYPAVIEARYAKVPLLVLTADRPHELREVGAPQAIDQLDLYGKHVKWAVDMALPESGQEILRYARSAAVRGLGMSIGEPNGPVHFNFPLREPLIPDLREDLFQEGTAKRVYQGERTLAPDQADELEKILSERSRGIIICGPGMSPDGIQAVADFGRAKGFPILADPLSNMRSGKHGTDGIIDAYDTFLKAGAVGEDLKPDLIIRFGAMAVSKPLMLFLKGLEEVPQFVITRGEEWQDPTGRGTHYVYAHERHFCHRFAGESGTRDWMEKWISLNERTKNLMQDVIGEWDEGKAVKCLLETIPEQSSVFVSNSMPIRDVDTFFFSNDRSISIHANRGANGIDGVVSTALGMSTQSPSTYLLIGDLAFFHDMNGLLAGRKYGLDLTVIVMNNNGGGIFSYLPQANEGAYFEELFGTPMDLEFSHVAAMYGADYSLVKTESDFLQALRQAEGMKGLKIIEVLADRQKNVENHRKMWEFVSREIQGGQPS
ncbi:2-succinyl-5-enolpyruvyl-6-hydroxy-3-cyclohexene-1-carboxylic-acid synthase [Rossellomorea marisflavi]|uniref:2-succinyl-5-enolpyruvyl-6-hydroxy-3- cyclohexene-1-carboxylic-acid synthase n=1 Tax=Rossellomorea marisflavi TaxID=189381 RepID=UPI003D2ED379